MSKNSADEAHLGELHNILTKTYIKLLSDLKDKEGNIVKDVSPALLSSVAKFLKDNEIQFSSIDVDNLKDIKDRLEQNSNLRNSQKVVNIRSLSITED